jgi:hypothetical protein
MVGELGHLSRMRVGEAIAEESDVTVARDGTTKQGRHLYGMKVMTKTPGTLTVRMRETPDTTAVSCFESCMTMINDVEDSTGTEHLITTVFYGMSDRCATEGKVNRLMKERKERTRTD